MTREEAEEYAKTMSFRQAVYNAMAGKCIPFRKATAIKLRELLLLADEIDRHRKEEPDMFIKLGELTLDRTVVYYDDVAKALEEAGYILVLEDEDVCTRNYIIAKAESEEQR